MDITQHTDSVDDERVNRIVRSFIGILHLLFPGRIRACYLTGSSIDGTAAQVPGDSLNSSDIDLSVIFKGRAEPGELERFRECRQACEELSGLGLDQLDAVAIDGERLFHEGNVTIKRASVLVDGEDIRDAIPMPQLRGYVQHAITLSIDLIGTLRGTEDGKLSVPLTYPDVAGRFYGYDYHEAACGDVPGTRILVDSVTWGAAAIVAIKTGHFAGTKRDAVRMYGEYVSDEHSQFIERIYECCKLIWRYGIPQDADERQQLRDLCYQVPGFENHLMVSYVEYLNRFLQQGERSHDFAAAMLERVVYRDSR